jgi:hypothetical protein
MQIWSSIDRTRTVSITVKPTQYGFTASVRFSTKLPSIMGWFRTTQSIGYQTLTREDAVHGALKHFRHAAGSCDAFVAWN